MPRRPKPACPGPECRCLACAEVRLAAYRATPLEPAHARNFVFGTLSEAAGMWLRARQLRRVSADTAVLIDSGGAGWRIAVDRVALCRHCHGSGQASSFDHGWRRLPPPACAYCLGSGLPGRGRGTVAEPLGRCDACGEARPPAEVVELPTTASNDGDHAAGRRQAAS